MRDILRSAIDAMQTARNTIEVISYQNSKLNRLIEALNQRPDVTDDTRRFIVKYLNADKEKLN